MVLRNVPFIAPKGRRLLNLPPASTRRAPYRRPGRRRPSPVPLLVLVLVTFGGACASATTDRPAAQQGGQAEVPQELVVGARADSWPVEPPPNAAVATGSGPTDVDPSVLETLVAVGADFSLQPTLATSWEFVEPQTWVFRLRSGATFHNGQPFTSEAVVYTVNELWAKSAKRTSLMISPGAARAVDPLTVEVVTDAPNLRLVEQITRNTHGIVAPGTFPGLATNPENTPTGTGPMRLVRYDRGKELVVERYDGHWGTRANLAKITFRFLADDVARVLALRAGEVDAIYDVPKEQAEEVDRADKIGVMRSSIGAFSGLLLNLNGVAPFDILKDLKVRQAVALALNREAIVRATWQGNAQVMSTFIPSQLLGPHASLVKGYPYDPARARGLLDDAGWRADSDGIRSKDGRRLKLSMTVLTPDLQRPMPEVVQAQLKEVGIELDIFAPGDSNAAFARRTSGEYDLFGAFANQHTAELSSIASLFTATGGPASSARFIAPGADYDAHYTRIFSTVALADVQRASAQAISVAVDQYVAGICIAGVFRIWGLSDRIEGFEPHPSSANQKWHSVRLRAP